MSKPNPWDHFASLAQSHLNWSPNSRVDAATATTGERAITYAVLAVLEAVKPQPVQVSVTVNADEITTAVQEALK